jgi:hypothetical protein
MARKTRLNSLEDWGCQWFGFPPVGIFCSSCPFKQIEGHCLMFDPPEEWPSSFTERMAGMSQTQRVEFDRRLVDFLADRCYTHDMVISVLLDMGKLQGRA